ncbi:MAG: DUF1285 domain-containing protein [Pseudomonadales bacterium]|nr:DUF1285 domain-containing protein [Pseudomonadales bacterium]
MSSSGVDGFLSFASQLDRQKLPPVEQWNPACCGDIAIHIARNGSWYHEGRIFQRPALVKLLSSILRKEGDEYFLVSPVEKMRITVEDVPFIAVELRQEKDDKQQPVLLFRTLTDDIVRLDAEHPLRVQTDSLTGEPRPYIMVRGGMEARIHRPVFYEMVELGHVVVQQGWEHLFISSAGIEFDLGRL